MTLRADLFPKLRTPQIVARYMSKKSGPLSKDPLLDNMLNGFKHCCDLENSTVAIFTDHLEGN